MKGDVLTLTSEPNVSQRVTIKVQGDQITRRADQAIMDVDKEEVTRGRNRVYTNPDPSKIPKPAVAISSLDEHSLTRVTPVEPNQPAIVGIWGYKNKSGRTVLERYTAKRHFAVLEPLGAQRGTYKLANDKLSVTASDATTEVPIICGKNSFELEVGAGKMKFVKFD